MAGKKKRCSNVNRKGNFQKYAISKRSEENTARRMVKDCKKNEDFIGSLRKNIDYNGNPDVKRFAEKLIKQKL